MVKHISALKKLDSRSQYLGAITDLIKTANSWLAEHKPDLKAEMDGCWEGIFQELSRQYTRESVL
jgi:hypothetical protein